MKINSVQPINREEILSQLHALLPELAERYEVSKIGIFGSVARNESTDKSDIDIVVHMEPNMFKRVHLKEELEKHFERDVDVIRYWYGMNKFLKARIDRDALYA
ncbi:MAG: nucleotidyltransferase family protein [Spirulinaceae cyanobacterium]